MVWITKISNNLRKVVPKKDTHFSTAKTSQKIEKVSKNRIFESVPGYNNPIFGQLFALEVGSIFFQFQNSQKKMTNFAQKPKMFRLCAVNVLSYAKSVRYAEPKLSDD